MGGPVLRTLHANRAILGTQSVNEVKGQTHPRGKLFCFSELVKTTDGKGYFCRTASTVSPIMAILFGRTVTAGVENCLLVDGWMQFRMGSNEQVKLILDFHKAMDNVLAGAYAQLQDKNSNQTKYLANDPIVKKTAGRLSQLLDMDMRGYEAYISTLPVGGKKRRRNRSGRY
jgi:hypothetical protein